MDALLAHCAAAFSSGEVWWLAFLIGGLTGGFTHCLAMCGPYVACGSCSTRACALPRTIQSATGMPYHLGRLTAYTGLGFIAAALSRPLATLPYWHYIASFMLAGAGVLFLASCLRPMATSGQPTRLTYAYGLLLGAMPCGLLYAALMMAASLADPLRAALGMALFTLGTMPALFIASGGAHLLTHNSKNTLSRAGRALMAYNGLSLLVMAAHHMR